MKTNVLDIIIQRDYTDGSDDEYNQCLVSFYMSSMQQGKEKEFTSLFKKAEKEHKRIIIDPKFEKEMDNILYTEIPFNRLILA